MSLSRNRTEAGWEKDFVDRPMDELLAAESVDEGTPWVLDDTIEAAVPLAAGRRDRHRARRARRAEARDRFRLAGTQVRLESSRRRIADLEELRATIEMHLAARNRAPFRTIGGEQR
jgi:hypothetical protein